jgi:hypothetical protein
MLHQYSLLPPAKERDFCYYAKVSIKKSYIKPVVKKVIKLKEIYSIDIDCKMFGAWLMVNNQKEALLSRYSTGVVTNEINALREILQLFIKEIQLQEREKSK